MHFIYKFKLILFLLFFILSCSNNDSNISKENIRESDEIFISAMTLFDKKNYVLANSEFNELIKFYPLSNEAIESEIMIGFIHYLTLNYEDAITQFERFKVKYPAHKNLEYIFYMIAMCYYEQITHHGLDGKFNDYALESFNQVIIRYPDGDYAKDSRQKIVLIKSNQAAKHMDIGRFYLKEDKYIAALNRFKIVIDNFSTTKFIPEALFRSVEIYYKIGMYEDSFNTAAILGHNYPESKWYKYSYNLLKENESNESLLKKLKNIF